MWLKKQGKMTKECEEKLGKDDILFKEKWLKKKKKFLLSSEKADGIEIAIFASTLLYPNT